MWWMLIDVGLMFEWKGGGGGMFILCYYFILVSVKLLNLILCKNKRLVFDLLGFDFFRF